MNTEQIMGMTPTMFSVKKRLAKEPDLWLQGTCCLSEFKNLHQIANNFIIKCFWEISADLLRLWNCLTIICGIIDGQYQLPSWKINTLLAVMRRDCWGSTTTAGAEGSSYHWWEGSMSRDVPRKPQAMFCNSFSPSRLQSSVLSVKCTAFVLRLPPALQITSQLHN